MESRYMTTQINQIQDKMQLAVWLAVCIEAKQGNLMNNDHSSEIFDNFSSEKVLKSPQNGGKQSVQKARQNQKRYELTTHIYHFMLLKTNIHHNFGYSSVQIT